MNDDEEDLPRSFDLLVWGRHHEKALKALARSKLPQEVQLTAGPAGAVLKIPLTIDREFIEALLARLERAQLEGGLHLGTLPDRPLTQKRLREEWASAVRTRRIAVPLTKKDLEDTVPGFAASWSFDDF